MRWLALGLLLVAGCGNGGTPDAKTPSAVADPGARAKPAFELPPPRKADLPPVVRPLPKDAAFYAYVDGERFRASPLHSLVTSVVAEAGDSPTADVQRACGFDPVEALNAVAVAGQVVPGSGPSLVAVLDLDRGPWAGLECLKKLGGHDEPSLGGVVLDHDLVALEAGRYIVIGDPKSARLVAARLGEKAVSALPPAFSEALAAHPDAVLVAAGRLGMAMPESPFGWARLHVESSARRFLLHAEAETTDASSAHSYAAALDPSRLFAGKSDLPRVRVFTEKGRIVWELAVEGGATDQAYRLGIASALATSAFRRYVARAKTSEATANVKQISRALAAYAAKQPAGRVRFPASAPRTPKQVPAGKKVELTAADFAHPTWKALGFSLLGPTYYSYEIVTAPGGKKTVASATGDLDGDGVLSSFRLEMQINAHDEVQVSPYLLIDNELE